MMKPIRSLLLSVAAALVFLVAAAPDASAQYNRGGFTIGRGTAEGAPNQNSYGFELMVSSYIFHPTPFFLDFGLEGDVRHISGSLDNAYRLGIPVNLVMDVLDITRLSHLCVYGGATGGLCLTRPYSIEAGPHDPENRFLVSANLGATLYLHRFFVSCEYRRDLMPCQANGPKYAGLRLSVGMTFKHDY